MMAVSVDAVCVEAIGLHRPSMRGIALSVCSLDQPLDRRDPDVTMGDLLEPTQPTQDAEVLAAEVSAALDRAMAALTDDQRAAVSLRLRGEATLEEAGRAIGVSRERIRQLETQTLIRVRAALGVSAPIPPRLHRASAADGYCGSCGVALPADTRYRNCDYCREQERTRRSSGRARTAAMRERRLAAGQCIYCGRVREDQRLKMCARCREKSARRWRARGTR